VGFVPAILARSIGRALGKWANEEVKTKQQAQVVYERFRQAVRDGRTTTEDDRLDEPLTFNQLTDLYVERYVKPRVCELPMMSNTGSSR
jgi:hypothetical protein